MIRAARPVIAAQAGLVSLPAATYAAAGRVRASTNAHTASARVPYRRTSKTKPSKPTGGEYPPRRARPAVSRGVPPAAGASDTDSTGPRSAGAAPGPWAGCRVSAVALAGDGGRVGA